MCFDILWICPGSSRLFERSLHNQLVRSAAPGVHGAGRKTQLSIELSNRRPVGHADLRSHLSSILRMANIFLLVPETYAKQTITTFTSITCCHNLPPLLILLR